MIRGLVFLFLVLASCLTPGSQIALYPPTVPKAPSGQGSKGAIASAHALASQAGLDVLKAGGNAIDAAVAASFVISVVRPQSTGLGGGGFMVFREAKSGEAYAIDFRERAPERASRDMFVDAKGNPISAQAYGKALPNASVNGHLAVGVPGLVAGLFEIHKKFGTKTWAELLEPAIKAAENGFAVYPALAQALNDRREILAAFPATRAIFFKGEEPLRLGETLIQKDLAETIRTLQKQGIAPFYQGKIAQDIVAEMRRGHGILSATDLQKYRVLWRKALFSKFKGHTIIGMPPPSSGGVHIAEILNILAQEDFKSLPWNSSEYVHLLTEAMKRAFADRARYLGDADFVKVPVAQMMDPTYGQRLRKSIDPHRATPSASILAGSLFAESSGTSHISIIDAFGNGVATTQTINYSFGSGVVVPGTGIILNDEMDDFSIRPGTPNVYGLVGSEANAVAARKTMLSSMSPTLVVSEAGHLELAVGSPGGPRIISATLQTILNALAFQLPLDTAVGATRIHHQWLPDKLFIEKDRVNTQTAEVLQGQGHVLEWTERIGDVQAVGRNENGVMNAASDPRDVGAALVF